MSNRSATPSNLVKGATRKNATLDKIYTSLAHWFQAPTVLPAITKSDHDSVIMVPTRSPPRPRRHTINLYRRSLDPNGKAMLCQCLKHLNWTPLFNLQNCALMVDLFYLTIIPLLDYYLPIIKITKCSTDKPWVTPDFRGLIKNDRRHSCLAT